MDYITLETDQILPHAVEQLRLHVIPETHPNEDPNSDRIYKNMAAILARSEVVMPPHPLGNETELLVKGRKGGLRAIAQVSATGAIVEYLKRKNQVKPRAELCAGIVTNATTYVAEVSLPLPEASK